MFMRSQMPTWGVGRLASNLRLSIVVNMPNRRKIKTMATEKRRKAFPKTDAPKPIMTNINVRWANAQTTCSVSVSVPPPAAMTSLRCIGGQKNPKTASKIITAATTSRDRVLFADNKIPNPKAIYKRE